MVAAAQKGDLEAMQFLLGIGVSPGGANSATLFAAVLGRCDACVRLLLEKGAPADGVRANGGGVLNETAKRAMPELSQLLLDHGASLESKDREGFTLLMQAVLSMEAARGSRSDGEVAAVEGVDPNATNDRGETAYQLAARMGSASTLELLVKAGAKDVNEEWPKPSGGAPTARAALEKILPLIERVARPSSRAGVACRATTIRSPR